MVAQLVAQSLRLNPERGIQELTSRITAQKHSFLIWVTGADSAWVSRKGTHNVLGLYNKYLINDRCYSLFS